MEEVSKVIDDHRKQHILHRRTATHNKLTRLRHYSPGLREPEPGRIPTQRRKVGMKFHP